MKNEDQPWSDNYPPLRDWLRSRVFDRGGRCVSQDFGPKKRYAYEKYFVGGKLIIVLVLADRKGWDVFVPACEMIGITATIDAMDKAVGFTK